MYPNPFLSKFALWWISIMKPIACFIVLKVTHIVCETFLCNNLISLNFVPDCHLYTRSNAKVCLNFNYPPYCLPNLTLGYLENHLLLVYSSCIVAIGLVSFTLSIHILEIQKGESEKHSSIETEIVQQRCILAKLTTFLTIHSCRYTIYWGRSTVSLYKTNIKIQPAKTIIEHFKPLGRYCNCFWALIKHYFQKVSCLPYFT